VWRYRLPVFVGVSLGGAALADFLFYKQWVGWTLGAYLAAVFVLVLVRHGRTILRGRDRRAGWVIALATLTLAGAMVLEPGTMGFVLAMLGVSSLVLIGRGGWPGAGLGWRWLGRSFTLWGKSVLLPVLDSRLVRRWQARAEKMATGKYGRTLKLAWMVAGLTIPLALALVFVGLFALANPVVSKWLGQWSEQVGDFAVNLWKYLTFTRLFLWYVTGFGIYGLLRFRQRAITHRRPRPRQTQVMATEPTRQIPLVPVVHDFAERKRQMATAGIELQDPALEPQPELAATPKGEVGAWLAAKFTALIIRSLVLMNLVFVVQLVLDGRYLVLGSALPEGMTYAEYAHRGAYPLLATALLAAALVLAVFRPGGIAERSRLARALVLLWIAQNVVLMVTAVWRLGMYVEVYSLTRMRVAAGIWMMLVAGCLLLVFLRIGRARDNVWLTGRAMGWGLVVLYLCCFVPFDPLIAGFNVDRCKELGGTAGPIDVAYLEELGPDALPAIDRLLAELPVTAAMAPSEFEKQASLLDLREDFSRSSGRSGDSEIHATKDPAMSLRVELQDTRGRLSERLESQLGDWRGWTARRAWLHHVSGPQQTVISEAESLGG